jgi:hypothetical protein
VCTAQVAWNEIMIKNYGEKERQRILNEVGTVLLKTSQLWLLMYSDSFSAGEVTSDAVTPVAHRLLRRLGHER